MSNTDITVEDLKKIGRSASISDRGILELFDNDLRRDVIKTFHKSFLKGKNATITHADVTHVPEYVTAAYSVGKWSISRYRRVVEQLKVPCFSHEPENNLVYHIESLQYALDAEQYANDRHAEEDAQRDEAADKEIWARFAIPVQGRASLVPELDEDTDESESNRQEFKTLRQEASEYFKSMIQQDFQMFRASALHKALYLLPKFKIGHVLLELVWPIVTSKITDFMLEDEIVPRLAVLNVIHTENKKSDKFMDALFSMAGNYMNKNTVNSILEYAAHTQKSDCVRIVIDNLAEKITSEGIVTSFIPAAMRGADHFLALLELFVMDRAMQAQLNTELGMPPDDPTTEDPKQFMDFMAISSYIFIFLSAAAGRAHPSTVTELIEFYSDPCAAYMPTTVTPQHHKTFIAQTFHAVCGLNLSTIAWVLVEKGWVPKAINSELREAVELGHQNIVHLLLESLLKPDEKMEPSCIPLVYRKSEALCLLPLVSKRFPREASWFLEQLSCIPIPGCVPCGSNAEPEIKAKPVHGVRLGTLNLYDAIFFKRQIGTGTLHIWPRLVMDGMLKQAGSGKDDMEMESVICAGPESLLTADAVHTPLFLEAWTPTTSPFIRLLAEDNPQITLQPVMRALMEFHWSRGKFWLRFAAQFFVWSVYVPCLAIVCIAVVQQQNSTTLFYLPTYVFPLSYVVAFLSCFFIVQEIRELHDEPMKYFHSSSNIIDTGIHFTILYVVIVGLHLGQYIEPILMSLVMIFCALRIISHLRVLPSVGPLVRLWVTASVNILPILIPYGVMALGFTIAFYIIEFQASRLENGTAPHFSSIGVSIQSVLTMAMTDYSVLDYSSNPEVFVLRFLFYVCFIIFLVNIIIALMTVNVADIHSNMNAAWLLEIAGIMVDLELFWPWPARYTITANHPPSQFNLDVPSKKRGQIYPTSSSYDESAERGTEEFKTQLMNKSIVLYSWPQEFVHKTAWWPLMTCRALETAQTEETEPMHESGNAPQRTKMQEHVDENYEPPTSNMWGNIMATLGFPSTGAPPVTGAVGKQSLIDLDDLPVIPPSPVMTKDRKLKGLLPPIVASTRVFSEEQSLPLPPVALPSPPPSKPLAVKESNILEMSESAVNDLDNTSMVPAATPQDTDSQRTTARDRSQKVMAMDQPVSQILTPNDQPPTRQQSAKSTPIAVMTGTRRPSIWTVLMAGGAAKPVEPSKRDSLVASGSKTSLSIQPPITILASDVGQMDSKMPVVSGQLDVITESLRNMERFLRQEAKTNRERIKRLEDLVENELNTVEKEGSAQKLGMAKLSQEIGRITALLDPSFRPRVASASSRRGSANVSVNSLLSPSNN
ncbi:hypothetical protein HDU98_009377 [Podochytrium sp. JEL0797]|nr:hypothetical protein HDU98_009377 [Podochytrium sp. JEL0797]